MNVSVNWLRDLVPGLTSDADELAERLSMRAVPVDEVVPVGEGLDGVRVARVVSARPHPDADRLTLCRVDTGEGDPVDVVCGAPDVREGALYPWIAPGRRLPDGPEIEVREIRGRTSHGMLCSERELGLGRDASGILRLADGLEPGQPLPAALELPDHRLVLDLTPNRVDLACHVGVAREVAPGGTAEVVLPRFQEEAWEPEWVDHESVAETGGVEVVLEAPDRCERYLGAVIRDVDVGPSPAWLEGRLRAVGVRPVNNVVDVTNYVLHELNQPLHAFDLDEIAGPEVRVRPARSGEELRTLDGRDHELSPAQTVIADARGPVALAGVMGGEASEVGAGTTDVFLECASFDPARTRRTARTSELSTDASYRFERGIDRSGLERALVRCVELVRAVAGGGPAPGAARVGEPAPEARVVELRPARVRKVLGKSIAVGELRRLLDPLGFEVRESVNEEGTEVLVCRVPGWRPDVTREVDLVEEVARRHGYESFASGGRAFRPSTVSDGPEWRRAERVRDLLHGRGLLEARSSPLVSEQEADPREPVELLHPLSDEERYLRGSLAATLLRRVEHNWSRGQRDVRLYEIGTAFRGSPEEDAEGLARYGEESRVGLVLTGRRRPEHWESAVDPFDVWDLKGLAQEVAGELCGAELVPARGEDARELGERLAAEAWLGAEAFGLLRRGVPLGIGGRVRPEALDAPPWADPVWALEFRLDGVEVDTRPRYRDLSEYPPVRRDLAATVPADEAAADVEATVRSAGGELLEGVRLFDVYRGGGIEEGRRSLAFRLEFRAPDRTLQEDEVEQAIERVVRRLGEEHDARIRSG